MAAPTEPTNRDRSKDLRRPGGGANGPGRRPGSRSQSRQSYGVRSPRPFNPGSYGARSGAGASSGPRQSTGPTGASRPGSIPGSTRPNTTAGGAGSPIGNSAGMSSAPHGRSQLAAQERAGVKAQNQPGPQSQAAPQGQAKNPNIIRGGFGVPQGSAPAPTIERGGFGASMKEKKPSDLKSAEEAGDDKVGKGYTGDKGKEGKEGEDGKDGKKKGRVFRLTKKRGIIIGSVLGVGAVGGFTLFTVTLAPLQFIHISETLSQHFDAQQDTDDESVMRLYRYVRNFQKGTPERTRLSFLGNKLVDRFEARMSAAGLTSMYTQLYGFIDGYKIDRGYPEYRGMNDQQLTQHIKETTGLDVVRGETLTSVPEARGLVIKAKDLSRFSKGRRFVGNSMAKAGASKMASVVAMRGLADRGGARYHPMTIKGIDAKILRSLEDLYSKMRNRRITRIRNGNAALPATDSRSGGNNDAERQASQNAASTQAEANQVAAEGNRANSDLRAGNPRAISEFQNSVHGKLVLGGAAAASIPCLLRGIANDSGQIKRDQTILPAIRMSIEAMATGSQVESSMDFEDPQLGFYETYLNGKDSRGVNSSFSDAEGWNALDSTGDVKGVPPDETLRTLNKGTPFDFLNQGGTGATLDVVCSAPVQIGLVVVTFLGGPLSAAVGIAASMALIPPLEHQAALWLSGNALNPEARGADYGNILAYGGRLAANDQALATGGNILRADEELQLNTITTASRREDFSSKSLAYRLFNPRDYRTPVAKMIDKQGPQNIAQTTASILHGFMHMGGALSDQFATLASGKTHAISPKYDWNGLPKIGMSVSKMQDARFTNPYDSSERTAATLLEGPNAQSWIDRAAKCNAVTISKDSEGHWNATNIPDKTPTYQDVSQPECMDSGYEWTSIQFFIHYTVMMNAESCRLANNGESCENVGFANQQTGPAGGGAPVEGGDPRALARQILTSPNIKFQVEPAQRRAFETIVTSGTQTACGKEIPISGELLAVIAKAAETYHLVLGVFADGHPCDNGYHPRGMAVDINGVAKGNVTTGNQLHFDALNTPEKRSLVSEFYNFLSNTFPEGKGGLGQIQCFSAFSVPAPTKRAGVAYFNDTCDHLHMDVRKNQ